MKLQALALSLVFTTLNASSSLAQPLGEEHRPACPAELSEECLNEYTAINLIHHTNKLEILQSKIALNKLQDSDVRAYAKMLIVEHRENDSLLKTLAKQENVLVSMFQAATYEIAAFKELLTLPRDFFDRGFLILQIQGHQRALVSLKLILPEVLDAQVSAFIEDTIDTIKNHLKEAERLLASLESLE